MVPGANRGQIVNIFLNQSPLLQLFGVLHLTINMRVMASGDERIKQCDQWTLGIGDGTANECNDLTYIPL